MVSFAVRHVADTASVRGVLASRHKGVAGGLVIPTRLCFGMETSYFKDLGDGSSPSRVDVVFPDAKYSALAEDPAWTGHRFLGWRDVVGALPNVTGAVTGNAVLAYGQVPYGIHTVHAQWQTPASVTFDATTNGGSMPAGWTSPYYYVGQPYGTLPAPTHPTLNFSGWKIGNATVSSGSIVANNVTLVAQYAAQEFTVDLSGYGGGPVWALGDPNNPIEYTYTYEDEYWDEDMGDWVRGEQTGTASYTPPENPDSSAYDGVYVSMNAGQDDTTAWMKIHVLGYTSFRIYIRSCAESDYDYTVALYPDETPSGLPTGSELADSSGVKASTKGNQNCGTSISDYMAVDYTLDGGSHDIWIGFTKDSSWQESDDRGFVLIPKVQGGGS